MFPSMSRSELVGLIQSQSLFQQLKKMSRSWPPTIVLSDRQGVGLALTISTPHLGHLA
jgi:hypothetical protein